jgi:hypothetical protein
MVKGIDRMSNFRASVWTNRDTILELVIIALIAWEIHGSNEQLAVLDRMNGLLDKMNQNAATTAMNGSLTAQDLKILKDQQAAALATEKSTLETISKVNKALQGQLSILQADQKQRAEELAKRPNMVLKVGGIQVSTKSADGAAVTAKEFGPKRAVYELMLQNVGNAESKDFNMTIYSTSKDVTLSLNAPFSPLDIPEELHAIGNTILVPTHSLLPDQWIVALLTVDYPQGILPFAVGFGMRGERIPSTDYGAIKVRPPAGGTK